MTEAGDQRERARGLARDAIDDAHRELERGAIGEAEWTKRISGALAAAYLGEDDPRWGSGFTGDAELWRQAREGVLDGVERDGTFLDVGCANGHLIESLETWARERGIGLTMSGLEVNH